MNARPKAGQGKEEQIGENKAQSQRFTKSDRVLKRHGFLAALKNPGQKVKTSHFLFFLTQNNLNRTRLGIIASKKTGSAVHRNRVKRRLREFFRKNRNSLPSGYDLIIIARKGAAQIGADQFNQEMGELLARVRK